jgi:hypothetical protein
MRWGGRRDSNPRRPESQSGALPAELRPPSSSNSPTVARPAGIEPATAGLEGRCSIRLSYGRGDRRVHAPNVSFRSMPGIRAHRVSGTRIIANWQRLIHVARVIAGARINCHQCARTWSGQRDSNPRPSAPKADALPDCAMPRVGPLPSRGGRNPIRSAPACKFDCGAGAKRLHFPVSSRGYFPRCTSRLRHLPQGSSRLSFAPAS